MSRPTKLLLVEDDPFVRESLADILDADGLEVVTAESLAEARAELTRAEAGVVLTDLRLPDGNGVELISDPAVQEQDLPVVVITGHGTVSEAVRALKEGAYDFLQKPVEPDQLLIVLRRALERGRLVGEVHRLRRAVKSRAPRALVGSSPAMQGVRDTIRRVAPTAATVLIAGESGTGKELAAAEIHRLSERADGPLVLVNCAAVPETLFESEFFGHTRGAFSGAHADREGRFAEAEGGTLVLDEVHTLGMDVQAKLLRVLETGEYQRVGESRTRVVDVRIVAVTNERLEQLVRAGDFREDLFYRLNVFPLELPPLREHKQDLAEIVAELFARAGFGGLGAAPAPLDEAALGVLSGYDWPGNVRELRNVLERGAILAGPGEPCRAELFEDLLAPVLGATAGHVEAAPDESARAAEGGDLNLRRRLAGVERDLLREALERTSGSRKDAAELLGIDPKNLSYYLRKHGLQASERPR